LEPEEETYRPPLPDDPFYWARFIRTLVLKGFGSWKECAEADLIDAMTFIFLENDLNARVWNFFNEK